MYFPTTPVINSLLSVTDGENISTDETFTLNLEKNHYQDIPSFENHIECDFNARGPDFTEYFLESDIDNLFNEDNFFKKNH